MRWEYRERFPRHRLQRKPPINDPGMHHGTCVMHMPWCMSWSPKLVAGKTFLAFPAHAQSAIYVSGKRPMIHRFVMPQSFPSFWRNVPLCFPGDLWWQCRYARGSMVDVDTVKSLCDPNNAENVSIWWRHPAFILEECATLFLWWFVMTAQICQRYQWLKWIL